MVFKQRVEDVETMRSFENDVNMYGIQTVQSINFIQQQFENDVNMYGIQTE